MKKKIKLSFVFIVVLSSTLILFAAILALIFSNAIKEFGSLTTQANEKRIHDQAIFLLEKNVLSTSQYYSSIFDNAVRNSSILADEAAREYDAYKNQNNPQDLAEKYLSKLHQGCENVYFNNTDFGDMSLVEIRKIDNTENSDFTKIAKILSIISSFQIIPEKDLKQLPNLHDFWITLYGDNSFYTGVFPNVFSGLTTKSKWPWKQFDNLMNGYINNVMNMKQNSIFWSSIHLSLKKKPLIAAIVPIVSSKDGIIGIAGTTLNVENILKSIVEEPVAPRYEVGVIDKKTKQEILTQSLSFILNKTGEIIAITDNAEKIFDVDLTAKDEGAFYSYSIDKTKNFKLNALFKLMENKNYGAITINLKGFPYIFAFSKMKTGWSICTVVSEYNLLSSVRYSSELVNDVSNKISLKIIIITLILIIISVLFTLFFFRMFLLKPIVNLCKNVNALGKGNFKAHVEEKGIAEAAELASTFNFLCSELSAYAENLKKEIKQRKIIETELKIAGNIQTSMLPKINTKFNTESFTIAANLSSAKEASGDFYDAFYINDNEIAIIIADVSGKGISAAFFMAISKYLLKSLFLQFNRTKPAEVLTAANNVLLKDNTQNMFVTVFLGVYNLKTNEFTYSNAGHHSAILLKKNCSCKDFGESCSTPLGVWPEAEYFNKTVKIEVGNTVILYTDGVTEAVDKHESEFGIFALKNILKNTCNNSCFEIIEKIISEVRDFEEGSRFDDITIVVFRREA